MPHLHRSLFTLLAIALAAICLPSVARASTDAGDFWTKERMGEAIPADQLVDPAAGTSALAGEGRGPAKFVPSAEPGETPDSGLRRGTPATTPRATEFLDGVVRSLIPDSTVEGTRTHGKVFFTIRSQGGEPKMYVCSGTVVTSKVESVVLTAGHCVFDAKETDRFMSNWVFVPAYSKDKRPFGVWQAKSLATTKEWRRDGNIRYDIGAAIVERNDRGDRIQSVVGSRGIAFNQPGKQRYEAFGYPHTDPAGGKFDGTKQYVCSSGSARRDSPFSSSGPRTIQIRCDMTAGSSGGGWVAGGAVQSVTSYGYESDAIHLYGPYFSTTAQSLYKAVRGGINKKSRRKIAVAAARQRR